MVRQRGIPSRYGGAGNPHADLLAALTASQLRRAGGELLLPEPDAAGDAIQSAEFSGVMEYWVFLLWRERCSTRPCAQPLCARAFCGRGF